MKKVKIFALFVSLVFIFGLAFTSCRNVFDVEPETDISVERVITGSSENRKRELTRRESLALQKAQENHTISVNELSQTGTGQQVTREITMNSRTLMVHCNMGWDGACSGLKGGSFKGGVYSGWFIYGIFDTTQRRENPTNGNITAGDGNFSINTRLWIARPR